MDTREVSRRSKLPEKSSQFGMLMFCFVLCASRVQLHVGKKTWYSTTINIEPGTYAML